MKFWQIFSFLVFYSLLSITQAAEWPECRRAKLESLQLQKALRKGNIPRGYSSRSAMRAAMRNTDRWLWRECRRYSGELRDLAVR